MKERDRDLLVLGFKDLINRLKGWRDTNTDRSQMFEYLIIWGKFMFKICADFENTEIR